jgi:hypothetical protein
VRRSSGTPALPNLKTACSRRGIVPLTGQPSHREGHHASQHRTAALGSAAAWPLAARAQQVAKRRTIGFLGTNTPLAQERWTAAFVQRLHELGWIEGQTVAIEYRWAEGRTERFAELATELIRLKVDIIVTTGGRCHRG